MGKSSFKEAMLLMALAEQLANGVTPRFMRKYSTGDKVKLEQDPKALAYVFKASDNKRVVDIYPEEDAVVMAASQDDLDLLDQTFIVLETNTGFTFNCGMCEHEHPADLIIASLDTGIQYRVHDAMLLEV